MRLALINRFTLVLWLITTAQVVYAQNCTLQVSILSSNSISCSGENITLTAQVTGGTLNLAYVWNTGETTPSISTNKAGNYSVTVRDLNATCPPVKSSITLAGGDTPPAPAAASTTICPNDVATLTATGTGDTYRWYNQPTGGNLLSNSATFITPRLPNTAKYYVENSLAGCSSTRTEVVVTIIDFLTVSGTTVCAGDVAILSAAGGNTYQWYDAASGGKLVSSGSSFVTPALQKTTTYYVVGKKDGCQSIVTPVVAQVNQPPDPPDVAPVSICSGDNATLSATSSGQIFTWYAVPQGGTPIITSPDFTTPALLETTTYYVDVFNNGCTSGRKAVTVTVTGSPPAPVTSGQTICAGSHATLTATASGFTNQWFDSAISIAPLAIGDAFQTPVLESDKIYYVQSTNGICSSVRVPVKITVSPALPAPSANGAIVCIGTPATLTASALQGTFNWYDSPSGGNSLSVKPDFTTAPLNQDTVFYVQNIVAGCSSPRTAVHVSVLALPLPPIAPGTTTVCSGSIAVLTASGSDGNYRWFDAPNGGSLLAAENVFVTPALFKNTIYYVQSDNQCSSARTIVQVFVTPVPIAPTAPGVTVCSGTSATLNASGTGLIEWYDALNGGNLLASGNSYTTAAVNQTTTYFVQSTQNQCISARTPVTVTVNSINGTTFKYSSNSICANAINVKPAIYVPGGRFSATPSSGLVLDPVSGEIDAGRSKQGHYKIFYAYNNGACADTSSTAVNIGIPDAQFRYNGPFCQFADNPLPIFVTGVTGVFSTSNPNLTFVDKATGQIDLNKTAPGTYVITNTLSADGGCPPVAANTLVTIIKGYHVDAGPDQAAVQGTTVVLSGASDAPGITWSSDGNGLFSDIHSLNATYTPAAGETITTLTLTADPGGQCPRADQLGISFKHRLDPPTAADISVCLGSPATIVGTSSGADIQWYDASTGGTLLASGQVFKITSVTKPATYYVQATLNRITSNRTAVNVQVITPIAPVAASQTVCFGQTATLTATASIGTLQWFDAPFGGNLLSNSAIYTTTSLLKNTSYFVQSVVGNCVSSRTQVNVVVNPLAMVTSAAEVGICNATPLNYTITGSQANCNFIWSRSAVANISNPGVTNQSSAIIDETLINTGKIPVNAIYMITPLINGCSGSTFTLTATVYPDISVTSPTTANVCTSTELGYVLKLNGTSSRIRWSRQKVSGVSNPTVSDQSATTIREILMNNTRIPINVPYLFNISSPNCPDKNFTLIVNVNPTSIITSSASGSVCSGELFSYQALSSTPGVSIVWARRAVFNISNPAVINQNSDTITETLINTGTDPVDVIYQITPFLNGCPGLTLDYKLTIYPKLQPPAITSNSPVCINSTTALHTSQVSGASYSWTGPNGFSSTHQNPLIPNVSQANAGTYSLTVSVNGCFSPSSSVNVAVNELPISDAGPDQTVCATLNSISLNGKISGGTKTGIWSTSGSGTFSPSPTQLDAVYFPSAGDVSAGIIVLSLSSTSPDDCTIATSAVKITFAPLPEIDAGQNQVICSQDASVNLQGVVHNALTSIWTTSGNGRFIPSANDPKATYIIGIDDVQNSKVQLTLTASNGDCSNISKQIVITLQQPPVISAGTNKTLFKGEKFLLSPSVNETNARYLWQPNISIDNNTSKNPTITGVNNIEYKLQVTNSLGCVSEDKIFITVIDELTIKNTFTPNGDGINDTWEIPALTNYSTATIDIFDRKGQKVFHSIGYATPFDGIYAGRELPTGVYYYIIDLKVKGKIYSGSINLIK